MIKKDKNSIRLTLMCKNKPIIDFDYERSFGIVKIYHSYPDNEKYAPLGIVDPKLGINKKDLLAWIENRLIPDERAERSHYFRYDTIPYLTFYDFKYDVIAKGHGFNLTDQYWFKKEDEDLTWEEGNFFDNDFIEKFNPKFVFIKDDKYKRTNPGINTNGMLLKKWISEESFRYLLKAGNRHNDEQYNEVVATALFKRILKENEYIPYEIYDDNYVWPWSKCKSFITRDTEFVPALYILQSLVSKNNESNYNKFLRCCENLGIENAKDYLNKMITCDYLLANCDRHYNNFGAIKDVNTNKYLGMSPIFDTGYSLGLIRPDKDEFTMKPFYLEPHKQLKLVDDLSWLNIEKLKGFEEEIKQILKQNRNLEEAGIEKIVKGYQERLEVIKLKKEELERSVEE